jgi:hypothetical protein
VVASQSLPLNMLRNVTNVKSRRYILKQLVISNSSKSNLKILKSSLGPQGTIKQEKTYGGNLLPKAYAIHV